MARPEDIDVVAIAQGIIMGAHKISPENAALMLFVKAEQEGLPLVQVAAEIVKERGA